MAKLPNYIDCPWKASLMHQNLLFNFVSYPYLTHHGRTTSRSDLWGFKEKISNWEQRSRNRDWQRNPVKDQSSRKSQLIKEGKWSNQVCADVWGRDNMCSSAGLFRLKRAAKCPEVMDRQQLSWEEKTGGNTNFNYTNKSKGLGSQKCNGRTCTQVTNKREVS